MTTDTQFEPKASLQIETTRQVCVARFAPEGSRCYGGGYDAAIHGWDLAAEQPRALPPRMGHNGWVQCLAFQPAGELLFSADSWGQLRATRPDDSLAWRHEQAHDGWIRDLCVSGDGQRLATAGRDRRVRVWSAADGQLLHELPDHGQLGDTAEDNDLFAVAFHPDGHSLVSADMRGTLRHWKIAGGELVGEARVGALHLFERLQDVGGVRALRFHDDGNTLIVGGGEPKNTGTVQAVPALYELAWPTLEVRRTIHLGEARDGFVFDLAWHPGGFWAVVCCGTPGQGKFLLLRPGDEKPCFESTKMSNCHSIDIDAAGRILIAATNRSSQGNGAVKDKDGNYLGNSSPLHVFTIA